MEEGAERLHRSWRAVLVTGFTGGLKVGVGVAAHLAVLEATGSHLLAGLAFSAEIVIAVVDGFLLAGLQLMHSVLDSLFVIGAIVLGGAEVLEALLWFVPTLTLNMVGGLVLVTLLRLIRTKELLQENRGRGPRTRLESSTRSG